MNEHRLTPAALKDLSAIWDYTAQRYGVLQANKYIRSIEDAFEQLVMMPELGRSREELLPNYRSFAVHSHLIFYKPFDSYIEVVRILHQRMEVTQKSVP